MTSGFRRFAHWEGEAPAELRRCGSDGSLNQARGSEA